MKTNKEMKIISAKKVMALLLAAVMVFSFAACGEKPEKPEEPKLPVVDPEDPTAKLKLTPDEWPVVDGATAMLPYYQEMAARILGISSEEAADYVQCSTTTQAYQNLAEGTVDMIFCAPPSQEQIEYAKLNGVEFESVQVLNSGFVFFVNKNNPVNSLTTQQIHDIYAGKITNWREVGGNNEPIIAYQRSEGSGSQTGLYQHVISKDEVADAPLEQKIGAMGEIIDAVANYDNGRNALGYSYYYYITNMHYQEDVKLIAIDNIYPTPDTITSDMYPFISKTCAVFSASEPEDSVVRKIAAWCHGSAGNVMTVELGYVPSGEEYVIPGYGDKIKSHEPVYTVAGNNLDTYTISHEPDQSGFSSANYIEISGLKDKTVQKKINDVILSTFEKYSGSEDLIKACDKDYKCDAYEFYSYSGVQANYANILSVRLNFSVYGLSETNSCSYDKYVPLNFDLRTGDEISLKDLFNDAENGMAYMNAAVYEKINDENYMEEGQENWWDWSGILLSAPFKGLKDTQKFTITENGMIELIVDEDMPEFLLDNRSNSTITVDGRPIIDFGKFASKTSLFEDESESVHLFSRASGNPCENNELLDSVKDIIPENGSNIWCYSMVDLDDNMTEAQKKAVSDFIPEIRESAKEFMQRANMLKNEKDMYADFVISVYPSRYGDFVNIEESTVGNISYVKGEEWISENTQLGKTLLFKNGVDTPLSLEDICKEGTDCKKLIEDAIVKELKASSDVEISDEALLRTLAADAAENITSFGVSADSMEFNYDDANEIVERNLGGLVNPEDYWIYALCFRFVSYRHLDCGKLNIFMIK